MSKIVDRIDTFKVPVIMLIIGYLLLQIMFMIYPRSDVSITVGSVSSFGEFVWLGFTLPIILGAIVYSALYKTYFYVYDRVSRFRAFMLDFGKSVGGFGRIKTAVIVAIIFDAIYIILTLTENATINSGDLVLIFIATFAAIVSLLPSDKIQ